MENPHKYFIKVSSSDSKTPTISSPDPKPPDISKEDLSNFPEINKFITNLMKNLQEKDLLLIKKSSELESLRTLLAMYRDSQTPLELSSKIKEITRKIVETPAFLNKFFEETKENEKQRLKEDFQRILDEKTHEIHEKNKEIDKISQEKASLLEINEKLQEDFMKLQLELLSTVKPFIFL